MSGGENMGNDRIQQGIWNFGLAVLLGGFVVLMLSSPALAGMSEQQCLRQLEEVITRMGFRSKENFETYTKARRHCAKGDLQGAINVIQEAGGKPPPAGSCTISGQISNDKGEYATTVGLYAPNFKEPLFSTPVDSSGRYGFSRVPAGVYQVAPQGQYPNGKLAIGPIPPSQDVSCQPNASHSVNFRIGSREG
jgi:hypothetical protein